MKSEHMAAFLEEVSDHLTIRLAQYVFDHTDTSDEHFAIINEFVKWSIERNNKDKLVPRGRRGKSYEEMREL